MKTTTGESQAGLQTAIRRRVESPGATNVIMFLIVVNAMQTFSEQENRERKSALDETRDHIEADLHRELAELRTDIAELRLLLKTVAPGDRPD